MNKIKTFILDHFEGVLIAFIIIGIIAIITIVYYKFAFLNFFFLPVILSGYFLGKKRAVLTGIFCILLIILYLMFFPFFSIEKEEVSIDVYVSLLTWGSFLILGGAVIGGLSEQREGKLKNLKQAYIGVLEIMLKYLEVADKDRPRPIRASLLAGEIAEAAGLKTSEMENIKSAALLLEAGSLRISLPFFHEAAEFVASDKKIDQTCIEDSEKVVLRSTASLFRAIEPILTGYFHHYVEEADIMDKNIAEIPIGSSIIALAKIYDRLSSQLPPREGEGIRKWEDIEKLSGRAFSSVAVNALQKVIKTS